MDPDSLGSAGQEVLDPVPQSGFKEGELLHHDQQDGGVEGRRENQEEQTDVGVLALHVVEGCVDNRWMNWRHQRSGFSCMHIYRGSTVISMEFLMWVMTSLSKQA